MWGSVHKEVRDVSFLLDSGATVSILAKEVYDEIPQEDRPATVDTDYVLRTSNGSSIKNYGTVKLCVDIQGVITEEEFWVCDTDSTCILGIPFMEKANVVLDIGRQRAFLQNKSIRLHDIRGKPLLSKVVAEHTVHIPPRQEIVVPGKVCSKRAKNSHGMAYLEPAMCTTRKSRALIARIVVDCNEPRVPVRLFNPGDETITVFKNATMGVLSEVCDTLPTGQMTSLNIHKTTECKIHPVNSDYAKVPEHIQELYDRSSRELVDNDRKLLKNLLIDFSDIFSKDSNDIGRTNWVKHDIDTGTEAPFRQRPRRLPIAQQEALREQIHDLKARGLITNSASPWASNVILVRKKDSSWRLCVDYRGVNAKTKIRDPYLLPRIDATLDALAGSKYYCTLDMASSYHQCELTERAKARSAFVTSFGHYQWEVMPFGLMNGPGTFQRLMDRVLEGVPFEVAHCYLDDLIVHGKTVAECIVRLRLIFERLRAAGLKLKPKKCFMFQEQVLFLGHIISGEGVACDPEKIAAVKRWCAPKTVKQLRTFIGTVAYYKRFVKDFAEICKPLYDLTKKGAKFVWSTECEKAFQTLKGELTSAPIMAYPQPGVRYIVDTDSSGFAIGSVLSQVQDGLERVISYGSRVLKPAEQRYCARRRELLAIVDSAIHYRPYLYGQEVLFRTDHFSLQFLRTLKNPNEQLSRWIEKLEEFNYTIEVRPGAKHANADGLSRYGCGGKGCVCSGVQEAEQSSREGKMEPAGTQDDKRASIHAVQWSDVWTKEEMEEAQRRDPDLAPIMRAKVDGDQRPSWEDISIESPATKAYWAEWDRLYLREDILYRKWESDNGEHYRFQLLLPHRYHDVVLENLHDSRTTAHLGQQRTFSLVCHRFFWYKMRESVIRWCKTCDRCQRRKRPGHTPQAPMRIYNVGYPGERIAMDICGPLPTTERGNSCVLVVCDYFSKWSEMYAIPDQTAQTVATAFVHNWVVRYGCPRELHTDQGPNFESRLFQEMCALLEIRKTRTTPYFPQSDGMVEVKNAVMEQMLNALGNSDQSDWDLMLPYCMMAYNSTEHSATGECPSKVHLGRLLNTPLDVMTAPHAETKHTYASDYVRKLEGQIQRTFVMVRECLGKAAQRNKRYYDRKHHLNCYKRGDLVLMKTMVKQPGRSPKLQDRYEGPFVVIDKLSDLSYRIQEGPNKRARIIHHDRLRAYAPRNPAENDTAWIDQLNRPQPILLPTEPVVEELNDEQMHTQAPNIADAESVEDSMLAPSGQENDQVQQPGDLEDTLPYPLEHSTEEELGRGQRKRKPPQRLEDYVVDSSPLH